jgi:hypothetical protein
MLWETVIVNGAVTAVKQMEIPLHSPVRRYSWRWLEDDDSALTDQLSFRTKMDCIRPHVRPSIEAPHAAAGLRNQVSGELSARQ